MKRRLKDFLISRKLDPESEEKVLEATFGGKGEYNRFYNAAGIIYRVTGFVFLFLFLFYLIATAMANLDSITYENAEYIVRNFAERLDDNTSEVSGMIYNPDSSMRFAKFGRGLAVCGNTGVTIFSSTGRRTSGDSVEIATPAVAASSKYVIAYDSGGRDYYVYNAFSRVNTGRTEGKIYSFSVADNGCYLYVAEGEKYETETTLCDRNFNVRAVYGKNLHTVCAVIDPDGSRIAIITLGVDSKGAYSANGYVYPFASDKETASFTFGGSLPLACAFSDGGLTVLCSDCVLRYDDSGTLTRRDSFSGRVFGASLSGGTAAVLLRKTEGAEIRDTVLLSAADGPALAADLPAGTVSVEVSEGVAYLLTRDGVRYFDGFLSGAINPGRGYTEGDTLCAVSENEVYYVTRSAAYAVSFDRNEKEG